MIIGQAVPHRQLLRKQAGKGVGTGATKTTMCGTIAPLCSVLRDAAHARARVSVRVSTASLRVLVSPARASPSLLLSYSLTLSLSHSLTLSLSHSLTLTLTLTLTLSLFFSSLLFSSLLFSSLLFSSLLFSSLLFSYSLTEDIVTNVDEV